MNIYESREKTWSNNFYDFLKKDNEDLISLFEIFFLPQYDKENTLKVAYQELDDRYAKKEQIERMDIIFNEYASKHKP